MKITKRQLRRVVREVAEETGHAAFVKAFDAAYKQPDGSYRGHPDDPEEYRDELATQIRHASKDIYGTKDHYDLRGMSTEELKDILHDLANSPEQKYMDDIDRDELEDAMGRDQELSRAELAPRRQGMSRRPSGSKSQRRMESKKRITRGQLQKIIREELETLSHEPGRDFDYGKGEGKMTRAQLYHVAEYAALLHEMIRDEDDLPEWVQSKVSVMASNIGKIKHYLEYKILRMASAHIE